MYSVSKHAKLSETSMYSKRLFPTTVYYSFSSHAGSEWQLPTFLKSTAIDK